MKVLFASAAVLAASAAQAHESFAPHGHPHDVSWLPGVEAVGIAALLLAVGTIAVLAVARSRRR
jgi:hypothetical protein